MTFRILLTTSPKTFRTIEFSFLDCTTVFIYNDDDSVAIHQYTPLTDTCDIKFNKEKDYLRISNRAFSATFNLLVIRKQPKTSNFITVELNDERGNTALKTPNYPFVDDMQTFYNGNEVTPISFIELIYNEFRKAHKVSIE